MSETPATMSAGQAERLSDLFDAHSDRLYRLARRLTANADDALDLLQERWCPATSRKAKQSASPKA